MKTYLVTYDLSAPSRNYDDLFKHLKSYGTWAHPVESVWLVVTDRTAAQVRDAAKAYLDRNDKLFVTKATVDGAWSGLPTSTSDWLQKHL